MGGHRGRSSSRAAQRGVCNSQQQCRAARNAAPGSNAALSSNAAPSSDSAVPQQCSSSSAAPPSLQHSAAMQHRQQSAAQQQCSRSSNAALGAALHTHSTAAQRPHNTEHQRSPWQQCSTLSSAAPSSSASHSAAMQQQHSSGSNAIPNPYGGGLSCSEGPSPLLPSPPSNACSPSAAAEGGVLQCCGDALLQ